VGFARVWSELGACRPNPKNGHSYLGKRPPPRPYFTRARVRGLALRFQSNAA
jgi:hypothetical protein